MTDLPVPRAGAGSDSHGICLFVLRIGRMEPGVMLNAEGPYDALRRAADELVTAFGPVRSAPRFDLGTENCSVDAPNTRVFAHDLKSFDCSSCIPTSLASPLLEIVSRSQLFYWPGTGRPKQTGHSEGISLRPRKWQREQPSVSFRAQMRHRTHLCCTERPWQ